MKLESPTSGYQIIKDISGNRYGKLIAVKLNKVVKYVTYWDFKCDCGKTKTIRTAAVTSGKVKTCGFCRSYEEIAFFFKRDLYRNHLSSLKRRSRRGVVLRTLPNELSFEDFVSICSLPCVYCGRIDERTYNVTGIVIKFNGVDRIDNQGGYLKSNCQPCCGRHNKAKGTHSHAEYLEEIKLQYEHLFGTQ